MADRRIPSTEAEGLVEAFARRLDANNVGGRLGRLVTHIRNLGAKNFSGGKPYEAEEWIYNLEIHFEMIECTQVELHKVVACLLEGGRSILVGQHQTSDTTSIARAHGVGGI